MPTFRTPAFVVALLAVFGGAGFAPVEASPVYPKMFVTSTTGNGNLSTWAETSGSLVGLSGLEGGDIICQTRAEAEGLATKGVPVFRAWLSTNTTDAWCHIQGLTGKRFTGSPCDGAGTAAGAPAFDIDGDARSSTAPDIGADEI